MMIKGFKFGLLLQFAVGPVCLFIFQTAISTGLKPALLGVLGVTLVDALFIAAAILGLGTLLKANPKIQHFIQLFGGIIVMVFGLSTLLGAFDISFLPSFSLAAGDPGNIFQHTMLLTLSNPLTILFWAGVFSAKLAEENLGQIDMIKFGTGAVLSTLVFLSAVSVLGNTLSVIISPIILKSFNGAVGVLLVGFGMRTLNKIRTADKINEII